MNATATLDISIKSRLRSAAMRAAVISVGATVLLAGIVSGSAAAIDTHPPARAAAPSALDSAVTALQPYAYWQLNDGAASQTDTSGNSRPALTPAGTGPAVLHSSSNPPGGAGGSVTFRPSGRQSGQYLRSMTRPLPAGTRGTQIIWFRLNRTLPAWSQTLVADNGAATGWGAGLFINTAGRLVVSDSSATVYTAPGSDPLGNNFCHPGTSCPHTVTRPLNDGRWHMAAFVDQYTIGTATVTHDGWLPSLVYVDGRLVDRTVEGTLLNLYGDTHARLLAGAGQRTQDPLLGKFEGSLSNLALFDRLLTAQDIAAIWNAGN